uniref:MADF domain-containing protein n=1 Tax=Plectus sambesii TaxID=2011161 RepID=A0A914XIQ7_9BILA
MESAAKRPRASAASSAVAGLKPDDVRRLIAEVRARPYLWDYRRVDHRDISKTRHAWMTIAQRLGTCSADEWRKTWKNKRDYYNTIANTRRSSLDSWPYSRLLTFLDDVLNLGSLRNGASSPSPTFTPPVVNNKHLVSLLSAPVVDATQLLNERLSQNPPASVADQSTQSGQEDEAFARFVASTLAGIGEKKKRKVMLDIHRILVEAMDD